MAGRRRKNRKMVGKNYHLQKKAKQRVSIHSKRYLRLLDLPMKGRTYANLRRQRREQPPDRRRIANNIRRIGLELQKRARRVERNGRPSVNKVSQGHFLSDGKLRRDWARRVCAQRKMRQQSLFALGKIGSGVKVRKERRFNDKSKVRC